MILLEHSTVVIGVFKFKFEYPICSIFREKSLIVLGLFHYKYCGEYLLCGRLQWERTAVESLNFLTLCTIAVSRMPVLVYRRGGSKQPRYDHLVSVRYHREDFTDLDHHGDFIDDDTLLHRCPPGSDVIVTSRDAADVSGRQQLPMTS